MSYSKNKPLSIRAILKKKLRGMIKRCTNPRCRSFKNYGGRGIYVCDEWFYNRDAFVDWALLSGYKPGLSIDRIDNDGPYAPDNCRWTNDFVQANNKTSNVKYTIDGTTASVSQWAILIKRPTSVLYHLRYEGDEDIIWYISTRWRRLSARDKQERLSNVDTRVQI